MSENVFNLTRQERIYCLKASSDLHSELCEECSNYSKCDHLTIDENMENTIKDLETLEKLLTPIKRTIEDDMYIDIDGCERTWERYVCPICGNYTDYEDNFCKFCGTRFDKESET